MSALAERPSALYQTGSTAAGTARPWRGLSIETDIVALASTWRALEAHALVTPYQSYAWVRAFADSVGAAHGMSFRYVVLRDGQERPLAILPLVITRRGGARFAEFIGGKHANYHMGVFAPDFAAALSLVALRALMADIAAAIGGLDAFVFVNQPVLWDGHPNPLAALASGRSPSLAYKLALVPGDCEGSLRRAMSSHAHKKLKNKRNRFASYGASCVSKAETEEEIARIIDAFLLQKAARFTGMGVPDPFADPVLRTFLERAARGDGTQPPALELYSLDVAGRSVATYVGAVHGSRFSGMATSFDMDSAAAKSSPGEILLIDLIKLKCRQGITTFDLGVGEARYKTTICDDKDELVDSFLPLTARGRVFAVISRIKRVLKRRVKASPRALKLAHRASGWFARGRGRAAVGEDQA